MRIKISRLYNPPKKKSPKKDKSHKIRNTATISRSGLGNILISQTIRAKTKISYRPIAFLPIYNKGIFISENAGILTTPKSQRITKIIKR